MASIAIPPAREESPIKRADVKIFAFFIAGDRHSERG
jgi:hypothetical protein